MAGGVRGAGGGGIGTRQEGIVLKQWRIQDFPEGGALTPKVGVLTCYFANLLSKTV